jgi:type I restriction enzyme S subunit
MMTQVLSLRGGSTGAAQTVISKDMIFDLEILLPPLAKQKRIVVLLDEAFAGIDEAKVNTEANLETAGGLFNMLREDLIKEPEADTPSYGFDEICKIDSILVDPRENENANKLHVGGANIESKTGRLIALQTARQEGLKSGKFPFQKGMVLYSKIRPNLMKVARPDFDGLCSADMYPFAPNDGRICRDYLYHLLLTERFTRFALLGSERAGMPKVNRDYLSRFTTKLPSIHAQKISAEKLDSLDQSLRTLRELLTKKISLLTELKSSLLSQAFAGELTA